MTEFNTFDLYTVLFSFQTKRPLIYTNLQWSSNNYNYSVIRYIDQYTGIPHLSRDMTKPTKWVCAQRRLRSAWASVQSNQSSVSAWRKLGSLVTHWAHSEDSDQTERMPRLIWVLAGRTLILLVLSCRGSPVEDSEAAWHDTTNFTMYEWIRCVYYFSPVTRKPVFEVPDQVRLKSACSATETS